jgi:hypothetical protein
MILTVTATFGIVANFSGPLTSRTSVTPATLEFTTTTPVSLQTGAAAMIKIFLDFLENQ